MRRMDAYLEGLLDPERHLFYQSVCRFAEDAIAPHLLRWEREHCLIPDDARAAMADFGLFGLTVDTEYGGQGGGLECGGGEKGTTPRVKPHTWKLCSESVWEIGRHGRVASPPFCAAQPW